MRFTDKIAQSILFPILCDNYLILLCLVQLLDIDHWSSRIDSLRLLTYINSPLFLCVIVLRPFYETVVIGFLIFVL